MFPINRFTHDNINWSLYHGNLSCNADYATVATSKDTICRCKPTNWCVLKWDYIPPSLVVDRLDWITSEWCIVLYVATECYQIWDHLSLHHWGSLCIHDIYTAVLLPMIRQQFAITFLIQPCLAFSLVLTQELILV